jgi:hypothetical protein
LNTARPLALASAASKARATALFESRFASAKTCPFAGVWSVSSEGFGIGKCRISIAMNAVHGNSSFADRVQQVACSVDAPYRAHLQTMMFLQLVAGGHLMLFLTRTPGAFWKPPFPGSKLFWAIVGTQVFALLMCAFGWGVPALPWILFGLVRAYNLVWMIVQDVVKLGTYRELNSRAKNRTPFLKHLKAVVHPHGALRQH